MDNIETEKSRVVLDELENDWWILAVGGQLDLVCRYAQLIK